MVTKTALPERFCNDQFIKQESDFGPFLDGANLTRDSYAGRGELETDPPTVVDAWGNVQG